MAQSGRPGPVLLDIPIDVQQEPFNLESTRLKSLQFFSNISGVKSNNRNLKVIEDKLLDLLNNAEFPLILLGGGLRSSVDIEYIRNFIEKLKIPCVYSLMGVDSLPSSSKYRIGMIGTYGNRWANQALAKSDLIVALGSRLDVRQTGPDLSKFSEGKKIFRIDLDKSELNGRVKANYSYQVDLRTFFKYVSKDKFNFNFCYWNEYIEDLKQKSPPELEQSKDLLPQEVWVRWDSHCLPLLERQ